MNQPVLFETMKKDEIHFAAYHFKKAGKGEDLCKIPSFSLFFKKKQYFFRFKLEISAFDM